MDHLWIGGVKANDVAGTIGFGHTFLTGVRTVSKENTGNGTITGDLGRLLALAAIVHDPDAWDCTLMTSPPGGRP